MLDALLIGLFILVCCQLHKVASKQQRSPRVAPRARPASRAKGVNVTIRPKESISLLTDCDDTAGMWGISTAPSWGAFGAMRGVERVAEYPNQRQRVRVLHNSDITSVVPPSLLIGTSSAAPSSSPPLQSMPEGHELPDMALAGVPGELTVNTTITKIFE